MGHGGMAGGMAPVPSATVEEREERSFPENALQHLILLQKGPPAGFSDLKGVPRHFYKFQKNSYRLYLTFRAFTKIDGPKQNVLGNICS